MNVFIYHGIMSAGNNLTDPDGPNNKAACLRNSLHCMWQWYIYSAASFAQISISLHNAPAESCVHCSKERM